MKESLLKDYKTHCERERERERERVEIPDQVAVVVMQPYLVRLGLANFFSRSLEAKFSCA